MKQKKKTKRWSKRHANLKIGFWNPWSYSNERHQYCKQLGYDVLGLTELHNKQKIKEWMGRRWTMSEIAEVKVIPHIIHPRARPIGARTRHTWSRIAVRPDLKHQGTRLCRRCCAHGARNRKRSCKCNRATNTHVSTVAENSKPRGRLKYTWHRACTRMA